MSEVFTLSMREAARYAGVSRAHLYPLVMSGDLPSVLIGRRRMVLREDLESFLRERRDA